MRLETVTVFRDRGKEEAGEERYSVVLFMVIAANFLYTAEKVNSPDGG